MSRELELFQRNERALALWDWRYYCRPQPTFPDPWGHVGLARAWFDRYLRRSRLEARLWLTHQRMAPPARSADNVIPWRRVPDFLRAHK